MATNGIEYTKPPIAITNRALQPYELLEAELALWIGTTPEKVVACSSGTAALHLAMEALELSSGSSVLVPDYTMIACARAVSLADCCPKFVDCRDDLLMDPNQVGRQIHNARAVMAVHIYGRRCDMEAIHEIARDRPVIEDMAELHGVKPHPKTVAACWSFYRNKIVAGEEGGCVAFKHLRQADRARSLRSLGMMQNYQSLPRGNNYRLANTLAQIIRKSLLKFSKNTLLRAVVAGWYDQEFSDWIMPPRKSRWVYDIRISGLTCCQQNRLVSALNRKGVAARTGFYPMCKQPEYHDRFDEEDYPNSVKASTEVIYLPIQPEMTEQQVVSICNAVKQEYSHL